METYELDFVMGLSRKQEESIEELQKSALGNDVYSFNKNLYHAKKEGLISQAFERDLLEQFYS